MTIVLNLEKTPSQLFSKNLVRIKYIQHIQLDLTKSKVAKLETKNIFLNQSYILQLVAYWQVFIEELAVFGFRKVEQSEHLGLFHDMAKIKLDESIKKFNTPNRANIDRLFKEALGIVNISKYWFSETLSLDFATATLDELLTSRHQIAHKGCTSIKLSCESNFQKMEILMQIADLTERALMEQLVLPLKSRHSVDVAK
jgi:hypothetical protein